MSYTIVYNRQFIRLDDKIIPLLLMGSNNCTEHHHGRERRERNWSTGYFSDRGAKIALPENELMDKIKSLHNEQHFKYHSKWIDDAAFVRFYKNGIKEAMTIEEIRDTFSNVCLNCFCHVWTDMRAEMKDDRVVTTSDDLREFLKAYAERIEKEPGKNVYGIIRFNSDKIKPVEHRPSPECLTDYYAVRIGENLYLIKATKRKIRCATICSMAKQMKTQKAALQMIQKIRDQGYNNLDLSAVHVINGTIVN